MQIETGKQQEKPPFPVDFVWGVATSAYQIEGAIDEGGRGPSIWDTFCRQSETIRNGDTGDVACDHYHRFRDDVQLIRELQIPAYRLSISWPRVAPNDAREPNEAGLAFYDALVDELLAAGIEPWVTLYHWDLPQYLQDRGGWLDAGIVDSFANYTRLVVDRLSDRVQRWITINEPQCTTHFGHGDGSHAPGIKLGLHEQLAVAHNILLAHGRSVAVIREYAKRPPSVGWAPVGNTFSPATERAEDIEAARRATMGVEAGNLWNNTWFSDPVFLGRYPEEGLMTYGSAVPQWTPQDMEQISAPLDFLGLNIYTSKLAAADGDLWKEVNPSIGYAHTDMGWPMREECLYWGPRFHGERYRVPLIITENGMANLDWPQSHGQIDDPQRIDYIRRHLSTLQRCIGEGFDVQGYFYWSLLDNFEWAEGYQRRFGLIYIDFETGRRIPKSSAHWYQEVVRSNGQSIFKNTRDSHSQTTRSFLGSAHG